MSHLEGQVEGITWRLVGRAQGAGVGGTAKCPAVPRMAPTTKKHLAPQVTVPRLRNPVSELRSLVSCLDVSPFSFGERPLTGTWTDTPASRL